MKKICKNCGAEYEDSAGEFCSRDCSAKFYDKIQNRINDATESDTSHTKNLETNE